MLERLFCTVGHFLSVSAEEIVARLQVSCFSYLQTLQNKFSTEQTSYVYILFK